MYGYAFDIHNREFGYHVGTMVTYLWIPACNTDVELQFRYIMLKNSSREQIWRRLYWRYRDLDKQPEQMRPSEERTDQHGLVLGHFPCRCNYGPL